mmetsp:Transcript_5283/g.8728  ORF Transcript_5283/g.8728 Transcript_5283/m.8728 type:complete len:201 (-) Transcript_5283:82-684(-)
MPPPLRPGAGTTRRQVSHSINTPLHRSPTPLPLHPIHKRRCNVFPKHLVSNTNNFPQIWIKYNINKCYRNPSRPTLICNCRINTPVARRPVAITSIYRRIQLHLSHPASHHNTPICRINHRCLVSNRSTQVSLVNRRCLVSHLNTLASPPNPTATITMLMCTTISRHHRLPTLFSTQNCPILIPMHVKSINRITTKQHKS